MLVKYWMQKNVVTIDVNDSMQDAIDLMKNTGAPLLPVLEEGEFVGLITDSALKRAAALDSVALKVFNREDLNRRVKVREIRIKDAVTIPPDWLLDEAAALLIKKKISGAPVVNSHGRILGTISQIDLFHAMVAFSGYDLHGVELGFQLEDRIGSIGEVTDVIRSYRAGVRNIVTSYDKVPPHYRYVYIRVYGYDPGIIPSLIKDLREKFILLYMVDYLENERKEFIPRDSGS